MLFLILLLLPLAISADCIGLPVCRGPRGRPGVDGSPGPAGPPGPDSTAELTFEVLTEPGPISLTVNYTSVLYYSDDEVPAAFTIGRGYNGQLKQVGLANDAVVPFIVIPDVGNLLFNGEQWPLVELVFVNETWRTLAPWYATIQQGPALQGTPPGKSEGQDIALSADGHTLAFTGYQDDFDHVQAWVFVRDPATMTWSQQANLQPAGPVAGSIDTFPAGCAMSADGNTLAVGNPDSLDGDGSITVYVRSGTSWSVEQVLSEAVAAFTQLGQSPTMAMSSSGNTLAAGAFLNSPENVFVWVRAAGVWTLQASLTPTVSTPPASFGASVAMSSDGNIIAVGGPQDDGDTGGSIWMFTRSGTTWTEVQKITSPADSSVRFCQTVRLSGSGDVMVAGSYVNNGGEGAFWIFSRDGSGSQWAQQGTRYFIAGEQRLTYLTGLALSKDGQTVSATLNSGIEEPKIITWRRNGSVWVPIATINQVDTVFDFAALAYSGDATTLASNLDFELGVAAASIVVFV
jgi:hypothetical protein